MKHASDCATHNAPAMEAGACDCVDRPDLRRDIEAAINRHSAENGSNTPDYVLAEYLMDCLMAFDKATKQRADHYNPAFRASARLPGEQARRDCGPVRPVVD